MESRGPASIRVILLMGVSGCGKTTLGRKLSEKLGWPFYDADDFHPKDNLAKMAQGMPLNDRDRLPWLQAIHNLLAGLTAKGGRAVVACSALKQEYRDILGNGIPGLRFVYLKGEYAVLKERLECRKDHYFKADLLGSQFEILEEPAEALIVPAGLPPDTLVERIVTGMDL
jgi:gluconokinase